MDILLHGIVIVEVKSVANVLPIHEAQLLAYMKLAKISRGLLINFNMPLLKDGITSAGFEIQRLCLFTFSSPWRTV